MNINQSYLWTILNLLVSLAFIVANDSIPVFALSAIPNLILAIIFFIVGIREERKRNASRKIS